MWITLRNGLAIALLLVAAAATTWLLFRPPAPAESLSTRTEAPPPGYYLRGARLLGTDENGRFAYRIYADRADESPDEDALFLEGVRVEYRPDEGQAWIITADRARAPIDGSYLTLEDGVELRSESAEGESRTVITTSSLRFRPEDSVAETDDRIEVRVDSGVLRAMGLRAHLKEDRLELESEIHGQILP